MALARLADRLRYDDRDRLAEGVIRLAIARMASAIREVSIERGHDPRRFALLPLGGAGPMHAAELARELGISQVVVPRFPGNLSAVGLISSDIRYDLARTVLLDAARHDVAALDVLMAEMVAAARASLTREGFAAGAMRIDRFADMRYRGQAFDLTVPIEAADTGADTGAAALVARFELLYTKRYGHCRKNKSIDIVTLRVIATGVVPRPVLRPIAPHASATRALERSHRRTFFEGRWYHDCPVYQRETLGAGFEIDGPAVIEEYGSTTVVPPAWRCGVDEFGNLRLVG